MSDKKDNTLSADEVREQIINEYEFDEDIDKDRIDKAVKREMALREDNKSAIGQKVKAREKLHHRNKTLQKAGFDKFGKSLKKGEDTDKNKNDKGTKGKKETPAEMEARIRNNILGEIALEKLDLSDELTSEIKDFAEFKKIPIKEALSKPYIKNLIKEYKDEEEEESASASDKHKGGGRELKEGKTVDFRKINPVEAAEKLPDKTYEKYRKYLNSPKTVNPIQKIEK